jgi:hypothetical protein
VESSPAILNFQSATENESDCVNIEESNMEGSRKVKILTKEIMFKARTAKALRHQVSGGFNEDLKRILGQHHLSSGRRDSKSPTMVSKIKIAKFKKSNTYKIIEEANKFSMAMVMREDINMLPKYDLDSEEG